MQCTVIAKTVSAAYEVKLRLSLINHFVNIATNFASGGLAIIKIKDS